MSYQKCLACGHAPVDEEVCPKCGRGDELRAFSGTFKVPGAETDDWPELSLPSFQKGHPFPYRTVPGMIGEFVAAAQQRGIAGPLAHAFGVSAMGLLAAHDFDVQNLAFQAMPTMISFAPLASSGGRKSTCATIAMRGHTAADDEISKLWEHAAAEAKRTLKAEEGGGQAGPPARNRRPTAIQSDSTIEATIMSLARGRGVQSLASAEANTFYRGWSTNPARLSGSLGRLNDLLDGATVTFQRRADATDVRVSGRRFAFCGAAQPDAALEFLASRPAADGFSGRVLYSLSEGRVPTTVDSVPQALTSIGEVCQRVRKRQDKGQELADYSAPPRSLIRLDDVVRKRLGEIQGMCEQMADEATDDDDPWSAAFFARGPENVIRLGSVYACADAYWSSDWDVAPDGRLEVSYINAAWALIRWYSTELKRLVARGRLSQLAERFERLRVMIDESVRDSERNARRLRMKMEGSRWTLSWSQAYNRLRLDQHDASRMLELLLTHGWLRAGAQRGRYFVNPALIPGR